MKKKTTIINKVRMAREIVTPENEFEMFMAIFHPEVSKQEIKELKSLKDHA